MVPDLGVLKTSPVARVRDAAAPVLERLLRQRAPRHPVELDALRLRRAGSARSRACGSRPWSTTAPTACRVLASSHVSWSRTSTPTGTSSSAATSRPRGLHWQSVGRVRAHDQPVAEGSAGEDPRGVLRDDPPLPPAVRLGARPGTVARHALRPGAPGQDVIEAAAAAAKDPAGMREKLAAAGVKETSMRSLAQSRAEPGSLHGVRGAHPQGPRDGAGRARGARCPVPRAPLEVVPEEARRRRGLLHVGDQLVSQIAEETPPGCLNRVMGIQTQGNGARLRVPLASLGHLLARLPAAPGQGPGGRGARLALALLLPRVRRPLEEHMRETLEAVKKAPAAQSEGFQAELAVIASNFDGAMEELAEKLQAVKKQSSRSRRSAPRWRASSTPATRRSGASSRTRSTTTSSLPHRLRARGPRAAGPQQAAEGRVAARARAPDEEPAMAGNSDDHWADGEVAGGGRFRHSPGTFNR